MFAVDLERHLTLDDYAAVAHLAPAVAELRASAATLVPLLSDRKIWMVNSTAQGGGVAEMLPTLIGLMRDLGLSVEWLVMQTDHLEFFALTKRLHNLIHGEGEPQISAAECELYDAVSRQSAVQLAARVGPRDIVIIHDPQPLGAGALLERDGDTRLVWRCHIGVDVRVPATRAVWNFLRPYTEPYYHAVFSAPEYIPSYLADRATVIHPAIDPLSHKNRDLSLHKLVGILSDAALVPSYAPVLLPPFPEPVKRLQVDGGWAPATQPDDLGLLFRPMVTQVSRWDRLKGFAPLLAAFRELKQRVRASAGRRNDMHLRAVELARLVLAGPEPSTVADDPEAVEVLGELVDSYRTLEPNIQQDVALLLMPMESRKRNALMVNALQRSSTIIAQNSLREGFGLTASEAMWKRVPVMGTPAVGLRIQIRDGLDGRLVPSADDPAGIAAVLDEMLADEHARDDWGARAQRRVHDEFMVFGQLGHWLRLLAGMVERRQRITLL